MTEAEIYLEKIPMWASKKNSLQDIRQFLERMENPDRGMKIIHVAGTNGKGSVCAYLTSIMKQAGYDTGTFISPHLIHVKERFLHNGEPAEDEEFLGAFRRVRKLSQTMAAKGYAWPTYFEFLFYMFMDMADSWKTDIVILETGLGGLLDTTNVIEHPILTVITSISRDHMQYLGDTISEIAAQKAGILKCHVPVVYDGTCKESSQVIRETAKRLDCPMHLVSESDMKILTRHKGKICAAISTKEGVWEITVPSQADYQVMNAALAAVAAQVMRESGQLRLSVNDVEKGIGTSYWPGRMEEVVPGIYLDGAHNKGGMVALTETIVKMQKRDGRPVTLMFGVAGDKEYHEMIETLCSRVMVRQVIAARMDTGRSADVQILAEEFTRKLSCPVETFDTVEEAWNCLVRTKGEEPAFCAGSLYLVGEVKKLLKGSGLPVIPAGSQEEKESEKT